MCVYSCVCVYVRANAPLERANLRIPHRESHIEAGDMTLACVT